MRKPGVEKRATLLLVMLCTATPAHSQLTNAETIAALGGRVIGGAKACGVDGARLRTTTAKIFDTVNARAKTEKEAGRATWLFTQTLDQSMSTTKRAECRDAERAFEEIEKRFANCTRPAA